jgi:F0F1-type ATP synthase membrane subunit c/vacuolar-type H+-ATPase subunit K
MRALCGAIITAGALIGLGLTAMAFGTRYGQTYAFNKDNQLEMVQLQQLSKLDMPLLFILVFLTTVALIGLGISFVGLAYHHHRRHHEMLRDRTAAPTGGHHVPA